MSVTVTDLGPLPPEAAEAILEQLARNDLEAIRRWERRAAFAEQARQDAIESATRTQASLERLRAERSRALQEELAWRANYRPVSIYA